MDGEFSFDGEIGGPITEKLLTNRLHKQFVDKAAEIANFKWLP